MAEYYRPIVQQDHARPSTALPLAGGALWFDRVEVLCRSRAAKITDAANLPAHVIDAICADRAPLCGVSMDTPSIMGILNVTPDSFSDGGSYADLNAGSKLVAAMQGADMIDIGGESTRPGAAFVPAAEEISRIKPALNALRSAGNKTPVSVDTRKAEVARFALDSGACMFNDVTALSFDKNSMQVAAKSGAAVCLMHSVGPPETMQDDPSYTDVLLDVYDYLAARIAACVAAGIAHDKIMIDPGIGFGKTQAHNLALVRGLSLFHGLGCPVLLGVSRKGFIGRIGDAPDPKQRFAGSMAVALAGLNQGVQMLRVHDIAQTRQAIALWRAVIG